jgi:hypothetical protein
MDYNGMGLLPGVPNPFDAGKRASDYADALAVTSYLPETWGGKLIDWDNNSLTQLLDGIDADITATMSPGGSRYTNVMNARARGLDTVIYEGGPHTVTDVYTAYVMGKPASITSNSIQLAAGGASTTSGAYNGYIVSIGSGPGKGQSRKITAYEGASRTATLDSAWTTLPTTDSRYLVQLERQFKQDAINRSPRMKDIYLHMLDAWKAIGLDANGHGPKLWNQFNDTSPYGQYGRWGMLEYYDQDLSTAYKWQGIKQFIDTNPKWWTD